MRREVARLIGSQGPPLLSGLFFGITSQRVE